MNHEYFEAVKYILDEGKWSTPRGYRCLEVLGYVFELKNPKQRYPNPWQNR